MQGLARSTSTVARFSSKGCQCQFTSFLSIKFPRSPYTNYECVSHNGKGERVRRHFMGVRCSLLNVHLISGVRARSNHPHTAHTYLVQHFRREWDLAHNNYFEYNQSLRSLHSIPSLSFPFTFHIKACASAVLYGRTVYLTWAEWMALRCQTGESRIFLFAHKNEKLTLGRLVVQHMPIAHTLARRGHGLCVCVGSACHSRVAFITHR